MIIMRRMRVDPHRPQPEVLEQAVEVLRRGGVVAYPTETFYGLGANAFDSEACRRILELKGREVEKALPIIVADIEQLDLVADELPRAVAPLADRFWPGPLTLVIPVRSGLPGALADRSTVAVRVSGLVLARELARRGGFPLTSTSANRSGGASARTADEVEAMLGEGLDLILDGGPTPGGNPSTIVEVSGAEPRFLRPGAVRFEDVRRALGIAARRHSLD
jgi:L-threonylcarbamoyladenylate synthase